MFQVELISSKMTDGEICVSAKSLDSSKAFTYFKKYSETGTVGDSEGLIHSPESEEFKTMKFLVQNIIAPVRQVCQNTLLKAPKKATKSTKKVSKTSKK